MESTKVAVPDYQSLMLPLLRYASDGEVHTGAESVDHIAWLYKLSPEDRAELLPSGRTRVLSNRTHWALTYLRHAALIANESHGKFRITERGRHVLALKLDKIDKAFLTSRYPEIVDFIGRSHGQAPAQAATPLEGEPLLSPDEELESGFRALRAELEATLLKKLKEGSYTFFEKAVLKVVVAMGYGGSLAEAMHVGRSNDGGIDGVINEDKLGLDKVYIQAKRWEGSVGTATVREFIGSLEKEHARKGIVVTTSSFSSGAIKAIEGIEKRVVLIDGAELVRYMVDYEVGIQPKASYRLYRIDEDFFDEAD
jgi:restriction system protein